MVLCKSRSKLLPEQGVSPAADVAKNSTLYAWEITRLSTTLTVFMNLTEWCCDKGMQGITVYRCWCRFLWATIPAQVDLMRDANSNACYPFKKKNVTNNNYALWFLNTSYFNSNLQKYTGWNENVNIFMFGVFSSKTLVFGSTAYNYYHLLLA